MPVSAVTKEVRDARKQNDYFAWVERLPKVARKIYAVNLSGDHGETWEAKALCVECIRQAEPPLRLKRSIEAGTYRCDFCKCLNEIYKK